MTTLSTSIAPSYPNLKEFVQLLGCHVSDFRECIAVSFPTSRDKGSVFFERQEPKEFNSKDLKTTSVIQDGLIAEIQTIRSMSKKDPLVIVEDSGLLAGRFYFDSSAVQSVRAHSDLHHDHYDSVLVYFMDHKEHQCLRLSCRENLSPCEIASTVVRALGKEASRGAILDPEEQSDPGHWPVWERYASNIAVTDRRLQEAEGAARQAGALS